MHLGQMLKQLSNAFERTGNQLLQRYALTVTQMDILRYVNECGRAGKPVNQRSIEEAMKLKNPTVTGILNRLEGKGFIQREEDPADRRRKLIRITERERSFREEVFQVFRAKESQLTQGFTDDEKERLHGLLERMLKNITEDGGKV